MLLSRILQWFKAPDDVDITPKIHFPKESISYVRPSHSGRSLGSFTDKEKDEWIREQRELGRYIVSDSHFKAGGNVRSIPRLDDGSNCTLFTRRRQKNPSLSSSTTLERNVQVHTRKVAETG